MNKAISVRISDKLASKLTEIAVETERSKSFHVQMSRVKFIPRRRAIIIPHPFLSLERYNI